ncbi:MAG: LytR family transcriptional regulator [Ruminococcaceae bacterium]|nr:LytR family transcriptional regulator [Oscillospiraceae bacterium]
MRSLKAAMQTAYTQFGKAFKHKFFGKDFSKMHFSLPFFGREEQYTTRRPELCRKHTDYYSIRVDEPERYRSGVEAASLFELSDTKRGYGSREIEKKTTAFGRFVRRHRGAIIAASILFVISASVFGGVHYVNKLFHSQTLFISDEQQAGNVTIKQRLTTSKEMEEKVSYFLLVGVDDSSLLTDCIWLACFDIEKSDVKVMQIPRDTYVGNESTTGKINNVYASPKTVVYCEKCGYSPEKAEQEDGQHTLCGSKLGKVKESNISALIRAINDHFGMPVDHFVTFNFAGFAKIINQMDGVDIHLDYRVHDPAIDLAPGDHHLTGWQAVDFMRSRKGFKNGDLGRVSNQRILIEAMVQKALNMELTQMLSLITACSDCFQTDLSPADITDYAMHARSVDVSKMEMFTMPGIDHWVRPNPSYFLCNEEETAAIINEKLLPYGLPDGSMITVDDINFPGVNDKYTSKTTADDDTPKTTQTTTERTTTTTEEPVIITTTTTTGTTGTTGTAATEPTTTTSTTTTTTTTTTEQTTTTTTTTQQTTTTTFPTLVEEVIIPAEPQGGGVSPLSDPRG